MIKLSQKTFQLCNPSKKFSITCQPNRFSTNLRSSSTKSSLLSSNWKLPRIIYHPKQLFSTKATTTNPIVSKKREQEEKTPKENRSTERQPIWKQRTRVSDILFPGRFGGEGPTEEEMKVNAYCTAEYYNFDKLYGYLSKISPKVTRTTSSHEVIYRPYGSNEHAQVFYFEGGSVVVWGASKDENEKILNELKQFEVNSEAEPQTESMNWKISESQTGLSKDTILVSKQLDDRDATAHKLAFSYGMHQSVKLEVYERKAEALFRTMKDTPQLLIERQWSLMSLDKRRAVKKKHAELLKLRADINLYSELLEIPDIFWDEHYLELDYKNIAKHLVIQSRTETVNKKIDYSDKLNEALRTQLAEDYNIRLEWLIIVLISVEVVQGVWLIAKEYDDGDNDGVAENQPNANK